LIEGLQRWLSVRHWQNRRQRVESLLSDVSLELPYHTSSNLSDVSLVRRLSDRHLN
jgi:hypothetical protein